MEGENFRRSCSVLRGYRGSGDAVQKSKSFNSETCTEMQFRQAIALNIFITMIEGKIILT